MLAKRIIPCLDIDAGRVKKGVNFKNLIDVGDPVTIAKAYEKQKADELVLLDITATLTQRKTMVEVVKEVSKQVFMPLTVGGGITSITQIDELLKAGADKVALNSAAVNDPLLIKEAAEKFGSQCIVVAIDVKEEKQKKFVYTKAGTYNTGLEAISWAKRVVSLGAGELLVTSMDHDGTKNGFDIDFYQTLSKEVGVPIIASGGAGKVGDFAELLSQTKVTAALAASVFHYGQLTISQVKQACQKKGVMMR